MNHTTMDSAQLSEIGVNHVVVFLDQRRFTVAPVNEMTGSTDLEATSKTQKLLVRVRTALHPAAPAHLSASETQGIIAQAARSGREAWQASVTVDASGHLTRNIHWVRLT